jgi:ribosomal-protein-alanine N-acetyltransferase
MAMQINSLTVEDCKEAARLHQNAFFKGWREKEFEEFLQNGLTYGLKIEENQCVRGYILWREVTGEAEILTLIVDPSYQRQGIGGVLLNTLFEVLRKKKVRNIFLEVAEDNAQAQGFYKKYGFILLSKRPSYYPREENKFVSAFNFMKKLV